ncbi:hypothetical protein M409DRAFT_53929 [Zasmidium cellare ATCC 36951]|uniref:Uncharacterized protein n=1 Tax=Zasmidium cellare ATCC 36951 TaxID=1080233 RepID=A0A6A6CJJ5_ZASCE|nr:uncharacterized protein M409DRAFT_53929 [Zasmidium cellare ATCC 36951]KAF2167325.1 hypothetical protein M409DRAFT_53929 [Zasmidium cellare ATCC 36951]
MKSVVDGFTFLDVGHILRKSASTSISHQHPPQSCQLHHDATPPPSMLWPACASSISRVQRQAKSTATSYTNDLSTSHIRGPRSSQVARATTRHQHHAAISTPHLDCKRKQPYDAGTPSILEARRDNRQIEWRQRTRIQRAANTSFAQLHPGWTKSHDDGPHSGKLVKAAREQDLQQVGISIARNTPLRRAYPHDDTNHDPSRQFDASQFAQVQLYWILDATYTASIALSLGAYALHHDRTSARPLRASSPSVYIDKRQSNPSRGHKE